MLPAQHQMADKVSDRLVSIVQHLSAKPDIFPQESVETKQGVKSRVNNEDIFIVWQETRLQNV